MEYYILYSYYKYNFIVGYFFFINKAINIYGVHIIQYDISEDISIAYYILINTRLKRIP